MKKQCIIFYLFCFVFLQNGYCGGVFELPYFISEAREIMDELNKELMSLDISKDINLSRPVILGYLPHSVRYGYERAMYIINNPIDDSIDSNIPLQAFISRNDNNILNTDGVENSPQPIINKAREEATLIINLIREYKAGKINMKINSFGSYMITYLGTVAYYYKNNTNRNIQNYNQ